MNPSVSIIIPSYNAAGMIGDCLRSVFGQKTTHSYEVIVVDSSADETASIVRDEFSGVRLITQKERSYPGRARNIGVRAARGDLLAFVDTKMVLPPTWLDSVVELSCSDASPVVGGPRLPLASSFWGRLQFYFEFFDFLPDSSSERSFLTGGNSVIHRKVLGGREFPEDLRAAEDVVLFSSLESGTPMVLCPELVTFYRTVTSAGDCFRHIFRLGFWSAVARRHYPVRGGIFVRFPPLTLLLFPYRVIRFSLAIIRHRLLPVRSRLALLSVGPATALSWTVGFFLGSFKRLSKH